MVILFSPIQPDCEKGPIRGRRPEEVAVPQQGVLFVCHSGHGISCLPHRGYGDGNTYWYLVEYDVLVPMG